MDNQMAPGDQIGDQISIVTKLWKLGCQLGRNQNVWSPVIKFTSVCIFYTPLIFAQKAQLSSDLVTNLVTWIDLVAREPSGRPLGRLSIRSPIWSW